MNLKEYRNALSYLFATDTVALVFGRHGIGKTESISQYAAEGGHWLFNCRLGNMADAGDLLGLPLEATATDQYTGRARRTVDFVPPSWMTEAIDFATAHPERFAIIHFDEVNRVRKDLLNPLFQLVLEKRLHTLAFPPNVKFICSANPPTKDYSVLDYCDEAFWDRFCILSLDPTQAEWTDYATATLGAHEYIDFIRDVPAALEDLGDTFTVEKYRKRSRRSTVQAIRLLKAGAPDYVVEGCIGYTGMAQYASWCADQARIKLTGDEVRAGGQAVLKKVRTLVEKEKFAVLQDVNRELTEYYRSIHADDAIGPVPAKEAAAIVAYIKALPLDMGARLLVSGVLLCDKINEQIGGTDGQLFKRFKDAIDRGEIAIQKINDAKEASNG